MKAIPREMLMVVVLLATTVAATGVFADKALASCNGAYWIQEAFCRFNNRPCGWSVDGWGCRTDDTCSNCLPENRYDNCYYEDGTCLCFPYGKINFSACGLGACSCMGGYRPPENDY